MAKREAEIRITGDTQDARASIQDLENSAKKSFNRMSDDAKKEAKEVSEAFRKSGIRTEKDIKKSSAEARKNFNKIKKSGVASANDIRRAHEKMTAKIKSNNRELRGANKGLIASFNQIKSKIATVALVVAGAFGIKAVGEAIKFEDALLDLQKVLSDSDGPAEQFADQAKKMALVFGVSSAEVLQSASDFKQAGFDISEAFGLTEASLKLVVASELNAAEASTLLVQTLNGFKAPASEANRLINVLNATSEKYATNVVELGTGMRDLSGIAKKAGFSFEETAGLLVPVISVFGSGSEAAQALKSGMLKLIGAQKPVVDELLRLGIHQREVNTVTGEYDGKLRSVKDILLDVSKAFQGMNENQKLVTSAILSGILQAGKMSEVFDGLGLSVEVTNNAIANTDSINREVATRMEATGVQISRLTTAFNNMAAEIGTEALPAIKDAINVLIPVFASLSKFGIRAVLQIQQAFVALSIVIDDSIIGIAKILDFVGITSNATDAVALDREKQAGKLIAIENRLFEISDIGIAKAKEVEDAKAKEVEATRKQNESSELRKQKIAEENAAMFRQIEVLTQLRNARQQAASDFVGPIQDPRVTETLTESRKRGGFSARGFNVGGQIPGYGGGDSVPIMAEPGEHVIRKESVKKIGRGAAQAFNRGDIAGLIKALPVQHFKEGGEVQAEGAATNINLIMDNKSFPVTAKKSVADEFIENIKSINTVRGRKKNIY